MLDVVAPAACAVRPDARPFRDSLPTPSEAACRIGSTPDGRQDGFRQILIKRLDSGFRMLTEGGIRPRIKDVVGEKVLRSQGHFDAICCCAGTAPNTGPAPPFATDRTLQPFAQSMA